MELFLMYKGCGMQYTLFWMMCVKDPLVLIGKSSPCNDGSRFPPSLSHVIQPSL